MSRERRIRFAPLVIATMLVSATCGERPSGPSAFTAELAVGPVFVGGEAPGDVGVEVDSLRVELHHGATGAVHVDTVLEYHPEDAVSRWILELESETQAVEARLSLLRPADTLYRGTRELAARAGTVGAATLEEVEVLFLGDTDDPGTPGTPGTPEPESVVVDPSETTLVGLEATTRLTATAFDGQGREIDDVTFAWSSSDPDVATVDGEGLVTAVAAGRTTVSAAADGVSDVSDAADVAVAAPDSVTYTFAERIVTDRSASEIETSLGRFEIPSHVPELGVEVRVDLELDFDQQRDEAFALGIGDPDTIFIGEPGCPVVPDDPTIGRAWTTVGRVETPPGEREFLARHAIEFPCYEPVDDFAGPNSVHFFGIRFIYHRID